MEKKTTAVQWLIEKVKSDQDTISFTPQEWMQVYQQALQMEKDQITDAYWDGGQDVPTQGKQAERYYQDNYKTEPIKNFQI